MSGERQAAGRPNSRCDASRQRYHLRWRGALEPTAATGSASSPAGSFGCASVASSVAREVERISLRGELISLCVGLISRWGETSTARPTTKLSSSNAKHSVVLSTARERGAARVREACTGRWSTSCRSSQVLVALSMAAAARRARRAARISCALSSASRAIRSRALDTLCCAGTLDAATAVGCGGGCFFAVAYVVSELLTVGAGALVHLRCRCHTALCALLCTFVPNGEILRGGGVEPQFLTPRPLRGGGGRSCVVVLCVMMGRELAAELFPSRGHRLLWTNLRARVAPVRAARAAVGHERESGHSVRVPKQRRW